MFAALRPGDALPEHEVALGADEQLARIDHGLVSEPLGWYTGESPWGGPVACPSTAVGLLWRAPSAAFAGHSGGAVGLFGAIEIRFLNGPLLLDQTYRLSGRVVGAGQSPKTEYVWFETSAANPSGVRVAEMRMLLRWMKASSPLYS
jgi:hypothetical protein